MEENKPTPKQHRAGFVNIIGNPNVGKSTLMNALVGENLSIVTAKAQTTRHRIMGILKPSYALQQSMLDFVDVAIGDADVIVYVTDVVEKKDKNEEYIEKLQKLECPVLIVLNKIDLSDQATVLKLIQEWQELVPKAEIFPVSAKEKFNLDGILETIIAKLPVSPPWYDKEQFTDKSMRFFASEIIREKILENYDKEIPYCTEVVIERFKEGEERYDIGAVINVMRDSQKGIIIGKGGSALKRIATQARLEMEDFFQKKVFLQVFVKVEPNWREDRKMLRKFGYIQD